MQQSGHDHDHDEDDSDEISYDEHIWTSPVQAQTLCRAIADTLCTADPAHAADLSGEAHAVPRAAAGA